ncbi:MAG: hypothetical protein M1546_00470 [Chloroflexi bacterium]|nr:hypothetical protein [Chloroflexota bacterium]
MKYSFETPAPFKQRVVVDRALFTGKVKILVDGATVNPSHKGKRGATGTFYPLKGGNENWVQLAKPMRSWEWFLAGLPLLPGVLLLGIDSFLVAFAAFFINLVIMRSGQSTGVRVAVCLLVTVLTFVLLIALRVGIGMLTGQG